MARPTSGLGLIFDYLNYLSMAARILKLSTFGRCYICERNATTRWIGPCGPYRVVQNRKEQTMLARLRAQAADMQAKAILASDRGDHDGFVKYHRAWKRLMKQALEICVG